MRQLTAPATRASAAWTESVTALTQALHLHRLHGSAERAAFVQAGLGAAFLMQGEIDVAWAHLNEALQQTYVSPPSVTHSFVHSWRGLIARARGDVTTAREMLVKNTEIGALIGHKTSAAHANAFLGALNLDSGLLDAALENFALSMPLHLVLRDGWGLALDLEGLSGVAAGRGDYETVARLLGAADAWRTRIGVAIPTYEKRDRDQRVLRARDALGSRFDALFADGNQLTPAEAGALMLGEALLHVADDPPTPHVRGAEHAPHVRLVVPVV